MTRAGRRGAPALTVLALAVVATTAEADTYDVVDLGTLGGTQSDVAGINELGVITGFANDEDNDRHPYIYQDGSLIDLGTGGDEDTNASAFGINNLGQVVGSSFINPAAPALPFLYDAGQITFLSFPGDRLSPSPGSINDSGAIVGTFQTPSFASRGFILSNGTFTTIPTFGGSDSWAVAVNKEGQVTGFAKTVSDKPHAFLYVNGSLTDLGTLTGPTGLSQGHGLNSRGQVVGSSSQIFGTTHAFLYSGGVMRDIGTLNGGMNSAAYGINASGQVVGASDFFGSILQHGFIQKDGTLSDLNDLRTSNEILVERAIAINSAGQIAAFGSRPGQGPGHALLLDPVQLNRFAYALASSPTAGDYTPGLAYNSSGGAISIIRENTGRYDVFFEALPGGVAGLSSAVAVTTVGSSTASCSVGGYTATMTRTTVVVVCVDTVTGAQIDSPYTVLVLGNRGVGGPSSFAMTGGRAPVPPINPATSWTTGDQPMSAVRRAGAGDYLVDLGTGESPAGARLVTATGGAGKRCDYVQPTSSGMEVKCYGANGAAADEPFSVLQLGGARLGRRFGFAVANQASTPSYVPIPSTAFNSSGGAISASRSSTGRYQMTFAGLQTLAGHGENVQATAMGAVLRTCNVVSWGNAGNGLAISIECRDGAGNLADTRYQVMVIE